jgi:nuclear pore complex protein Nup93
VSATRLRDSATPRLRSAQCSDAEIVDGPDNVCSFENHVDEVIAKHPKEAALGGVPGIRNKVRAFVDVTLQGKESQESYKPESVNGSYIWAQAYYLLRCGFPDESLALLSEHQHSIKRDDWSFPGAFKVFLTTPDRRLPRPTRDQLFNDFNASIRNNPNVDQFKYALYKLVGRFELNRKSLKVATTTEDWMWLQLSLVRESKEMEPPQEQYDLGDLGKLVLKYGNDKFDNGGTRPFAWFNLLLFTAQFERVSRVAV